MFFGGHLKPSSLRTEAAKGNLEIFQIARKDFVTKRAIEQMIEKCRKKDDPLASGTAPKPANTISRTESDESRQAAVLMSLDLHSRRLKNTGNRSSKSSTAERHG